MKQKYLSIKILILLLMVIAIGGCGREDQSSADPSTLPPLTTINDILSVPDRTTLVGRTVAIDGAPVSSIVGKYVFWSGTEANGVPIFRKDQLTPPTKPHVKIGGRARIDGVIRLVDNVPVADPMWSTISETEKQSITDAKVFISAESVQVIP